MEVKSNSCQINISELFQNLKNQVKIFDTLSKNIEPTKEQENLSTIYIKVREFHPRIFIKYYQ